MYKRQGYTIPHSIPSGPINVLSTLGISKHGIQAGRINLELSQATASTHWSLHSVRVRVRVRVGWSASGTTANSPVKIHYQGVTTPPARTAVKCNWESFDVTIARRLIDDDGVTVVRNVSPVTVNVQYPIWGMQREDGGNPPR